MHVFVQAFLIGLSIAMPLGPISFLCINKTLVYGFRGTSLVGLGACAAHGLYGAIALLGLGGLSQLFLRYVFFAKILGAGLLLRLGMQELQPKQTPEYFANAPDQVSLPQRAPVFLAWQVTLLTLSNPMTILSFAALMTGPSLSQLSTEHAIQAILGICVGSFFWRMCLGVIAQSLKKSPRFESHIHHIRYVSACVLLLYAASLSFDTLSLLFYA